MELEGAIGRKAKLTLEDGTHIDGFVHSFSVNSGKLTLEKVQCFENGKRKKLVGLQHYFAEEITSIILTEDVCKNKKKTKTDERGGRNGGGMLRGKCSPGHLNRLAFVEPSDLVLKNQKRDDALTSSGNETAGSDSDQDLPQLDGCTILTKLCNTFYEAIDYIKKHHVVAMAMEGVAVGRLGRLCWLQIAVPDHVFMFDVLTMGRACFEEGLKVILENEGILKVLHDCRLVSDILHHQYDINMVNVFDTQVADVFVYRLRHHHDWPRYVHGLGSCLVEHLDLPMEEVNWAVVREHRREEDEEVWTKRPPQRHLVDAAVKNVRHLLDLRTVLMEKMMEEFVAGVNIYLMHVRDASDNDAKRYQTTPHLLPVAFQDIRAFMSSYRGRNYHFNVKDVQRDMNGFRENCSGIVQPDIYFSKDSIWHGGTKTTGFAGPRSTASLMNSKVSSKGDNMTSSLSSKAGTSSSTQKQTDVESDDSSIPTRRSLHTSVESEIVSRTVAAMNAKKLAADAQCSGAELNDPSFGAEKVKVSCQLSPTILGAQEEDFSELKGGSLMRALIHEQDATGNEAKADMEKFHIMPAGKMIAENNHKKKAKANSYDLDSVSQQGDLGPWPPMMHSSSRLTPGRFKSIGESPPGQRQYVQGDGCDDLRPVIPGGDLATYSPPKQTSLTEQEQILIENLKRSQQVREYESKRGHTRGHAFSSDNETISHPSTQGAKSYIINQLLGKSSEPLYASDPGTSPVVSHHKKESGYSSPSTGDIDSHSGQCISENNRAQRKSLPSENSKLQSLMQKLKKQSL